MKTVLALALVLLAPSAARAKDDRLCPRVRFVGPSVKLSKMEKRLVCGDPGSDGWKEVSLPQAREFMTAFLQARGRHFPRFTAKDDTLEVEIGTTTVVRKLTGEGLGGIYDLGKRRQVVGELLTPDLLDTVKKAVVFELQSRGYPCPKVVVTADARSGEVHVDALPGDAYATPDVPGARAPGVDPEVFGRYRAYHPGLLYDGRLMSLTSDRIKADALFLSAYYDVQCSTNGPAIVQRVVEGKPHLITVGVGVDTEGTVQGRARIKQSRLGRRASSGELDLFASAREQSLDAFMDLYLSPSTRLYLVPEAFIRRESEIPYEDAHSQISLSPAWSSDPGDVHVEVRGGPAYDYVNTIKGLGPKRSNWAAFVTQVRAESHMHEYYARDPREGWMASITTDSRVRGAASRVTANRLQATGETLWNLGKFEPPAIVLATRGLAGTTAVRGDPNQAFTEIPASDRFFLGGDADLRGFPRKRLPDDAAGLLTAVYEGVELRFGDLLPANVQPLVFVDAAMGGRKPFALDPDVYYSPGAGFRWAPPFGSVRATVARGLTWNRGGETGAPKPGWQFFFSFGKEF